MEARPTENKMNQRGRRRKHFACKRRQSGSLHEWLKSTQNKLSTLYVTFTGDLEKQFPFNTSWKCDRQRTLDVSQMGPMGTSMTDVRLAQAQDSAEILLS
jgi:hypothetical protein